MRGIPLLPLAASLPLPPLLADGGAAPAAAAATVAAVGNPADEGMWAWSCSFSGSLTALVAPLHLLRHLDAGGPEDTQEMWWYTDACISRCLKFGIVVFSPRNFMTSHTASPPQLAG